MFRHAPPGPQPTWKRPVYLVCTTLLGIIVSYGLHAIIELWYLRWADQHHLVIHWYSHLGLGLCALHPAIQYGLLAAGIIGGYVQGRVWWRWVYVERRWENHHQTT